MRPGLRKPLALSLCLAALAGAPSAARAGVEWIVHGHGFGHGVGMSQYGAYGYAAGVGGNGFDLYSDTRSQVYKGLSSETARTDSAAESTRGQVVTYRGRIAETFFSACSGGHTESVQNVFGGPPVPYLVGVPDPAYFNRPHRAESTLRGRSPSYPARRRRLRGG